ncbi:MAG: hypothetical protein V5A68_01120 [Candidatus Thermoplasmatota archaeon]
MGLTIYILGILLGIGLTLILTTFLQFCYFSLKHKEIMNSLKKEVKENHSIASKNLELYEKNRLEAYKPFLIKSYKQFIINTPADTIDKKKMNSLLNGYIFAEEFNKKMINPEGFQEIVNDKVILNQIKESLKSFLKENKD